MDMGPVSLSEPALFFMREKACRRMQSFFTCGIVKA